MLQSSCVKPTLSVLVMLARPVCWVLKSQCALNHKRFHRPGLNSGRITFGKVVLIITCKTLGHRRRKYFAQGGALGDFSKIFLGGRKVVKFVFSHLKLRKQPFLLKFSKSRGALSPPFRRPCPGLFTAYWQKLTRMARGYLDADQADVRCALLCCALSRDRSLP